MRIIKWLIGWSLHQATFLLTSCTAQLFSLIEQACRKHTISKQIAPWTKLTRNMLVSGRIRWALAQSVSDHQHLKGNNKQKPMRWLVLFCFRAHQEMHIFQKWMQKLSIPWHWIRNGPRNELMLLLLTQTIVSCSNRAHTRGAVREPCHSQLFDSWGSVFNNFSKPGFLQNSNCWCKMPSRKYKK